jgi:hypothetical protein
LCAFIPLSPTSLALHSLLLKNSTSQKPYFSKLYFSKTLLLKTLLLKTLLPNPVCFHQYGGSLPLDQFSALLSGTKAHIT